MVMNMCSTDVNVIVQISIQTDIFIYTDINTDGVDTDVDI